MILPAIIPRSLHHLQETLEKVSFAEAVQIDVVDGKFVSNVSWPYEPAGEAGEAAGLLAGREVEVDLMVEDPATAGKRWLEAGAQALVFHIEGLAGGGAEASGLRAAHPSFRLGFSLNNDTPIERLYPFAEVADFVQLMGIAEIGTQGQPFDPRVLERITTLRALYPDLTISIDGGVNEDTIVQLKRAGANRFVAGSAILKADDPQHKYEELLKIASG